MKIELNIDASNIGETLVDLFQNLSEAKKQEIAFQVLDGWLREPNGIHQQGIHREAIEYARNSNSWHAKESDDWFMMTSDYKNYIRQHPTPKEAMIKEITSQVIAYHKSQISEKITTDPDIQRMMQETFQAIKTDFPRIVNDAMIAWFCGNMSEMARGISSALMQSSQASDMARQISDRVLNNR